MAALAAMAPTPLQGKYLYQFYARPFEELEEEKNGEIGVLTISCMSLQWCILPPLRMLSWS